MNKKPNGKEDEQSTPYYFRELESVPFMPRKISAEFRALCERLLLPRLKFDGYKQSEKREIVMQAALALVESGLTHKVIADSRNTAHAANRKQMKLWDALAEAGLCRKCLGSEKSRKVTRYRATKELLHLEKQWTQAHLKAPKEKPTGPLLGLVIFKRKEKGKPATVPFEKVLRAHAPRNLIGEPPGIAITRVIEEIINAINSENLNHSWKARYDNGVSFQPNVELVQEHIRQPYRGTRLYTRALTGVQNIKKAERRAMEIDGSGIAELDFSASIPRLAYTQQKIAVPADVDLYYPRRIAAEAWSCRPERQKAIRDFIKLATLICFNVPTRSKAIGAVRKQLLMLDEAESRLLRQLPEPGELVRRIALVHHPIADYLFADRGMSLISLEGGIMFNILRVFVLGAKKPAVPIHDALVVRQKDARFAKRVMEHVYRSVTGSNPVVKTQFA
jgi:hypothetical protein